MFKCIFLIGLRCETVKRAEIRNEKLAFLSKVKEPEKNEPGCGGNTMFVDTTWKFEKKKVKKSETHEDGKKSGAAKY